MTGMKIFGLWSTEGIEVKDPGLKDYVNLRPILVPKSGSKFSNRRFYKSKLSIVERLINKVMIPGHKGKKHKVSSYTITGKASQAYNLIEKSFHIIEAKTKKNPVEVFVQALENAAPREEIVSVEYGGARYPKAVECSPQRRVDITLRYFVQGAFTKSFNSRRSASETLAEEILAAYQKSSASFSISKKLELERQADVSR